MPTSQLEKHRFLKLTTGIENEERDKRKQKKRGDKG